MALRIKQEPSEASEPMETSVKSEVSSYLAFIGLIFLDNR